MDIFCTDDLSPDYFFINFALFPWSQIRQPSELGVEGPVEIVALVAQIVSAAPNQNALVQSSMLAIALVRIALYIARVLLLASTSQHTAAVLASIKSHTGVAL